MKFAVLDFVVRQNQFQTFRKDARSVLEEQLTVRRGRSDHNIAALLGLRAQVAAQDAVYRVHCLWAATKSQDGGICPCRVVAVRKDYLVMDCSAARLLGLFDQFRL